VNRRTRTRAHQLPLRQNAHRMGVTRQGVEKPFEVFVQERVAPDSGRRRRETQPASAVRHISSRSGNFDECRVFGDIFDVVAAIAQDSLVAIDKRDGTFRWSCVDESAVECIQASLLVQRRDVDCVRTINGTDNREIRQSLRDIPGARWVGCRRSRVLLEDVHSDAQPENTRGPQRPTAFANCISPAGAMRR